MFHTIVSIKNDGHYFCRAGGNRPDGLNEPVTDEADFPAVAVYLTGAEYTGEELDSDTWQAELHIEVFLPAQVPDSELDAWMESRIYPVMSDIPALSDLITSMVASGYDYRRDDDAGLWSSADLTYVITYEM
ncbi:phage minor tail protein [Escherichia coli]|nr:phage minor tail protein [Escherichia coli]GDU06898.1 phage minor tail protein [Escherichia coli]